MAIRHPFGGGIDDWIFAEDENDVPVLQGGANLTFWNAREGGSQYTNLSQDPDGVTPIGVLVSSNGGDGYRIGQIPLFYGPPDVTTMWVGADGGERVAIDSIDVGDLAGQAQQTLDAHTAQRNAHGTGLADLTDAQVGTPASRTAGNLVGWNGSSFALLSPAQASGAVLLNPPLSGGAYVGNIVQPPPTGQAEPWLQMRQPYTASGTNPDSIALYSTHSDGTTPLKTFWVNGNNEVQAAPSSPFRPSGRFFEAYEAVGGPSTVRFFELSTNPTNSANREALFGAYGTAHPTQPGWMVATRVLAGLQGVRAGGGYNGLAAVNFRGFKATVGSPTTGTWAAGDALIDSAGQLWICTASGAPGAWAGQGAQSSIPVTPVWYQETGATGVGSYPWANPTASALTLDAFIISVGGTTPVGDYVINPKLNGVPLYASGSRPRVASGQRSSGRATGMDITAWPAGATLTVDVDAVGATPPTKVTIQAVAS